MVQVYRVELDPEAIEDLRDIRAAIAADAGSAVADRFLARALDHLASFERYPKRGRPLDDLRPGLRVIGWRRTLTFAFALNEQSGQVLILAVFYLGRDVDAALRRRHES